MSEHLLKKKVSRHFSKKKVINLKIKLYRLYYNLGWEYKDFFYLFKQIEYKYYSDNKKFYFLNKYFKNLKDIWNSESYAIAYLLDIILFI